MIYFFSSYLAQIGGFVENNLLFRGFGAFLSAFICFFLASPYLIKKLYQLKTGQSIRTADCPLLSQLHEKKKEIPSMGGLLILLSVFVSSVFWMDFDHYFTWLLLTVTFAFGIIGALDDYLKMKYKNSSGLKGRKKLAFQLIVSFFIALCLYDSSFYNMMITYHFPFFKNPIFILSGLASILAILITVFIITGSSNAVNLTDGLDGLATGLTLLVSAVLVVAAFVAADPFRAEVFFVSYIPGSSEVVVYLSALIGSCLGFLWYNASPAQIFMGDTGSLSIGGVLGLSSVLIKKEFLFFIVAGLFVIETISVMLQVASYKWRNKKRIFLCAPLHHHFEYKGWAETKIVIRFWIVGILLAILGLISIWCYS
ncbi:MAG: phospho-N-acetylmuramoyl-pentapeptide-transferase [Rhabdochlamydiaceae bacterium]